MNKHILQISNLEMRFGGVIALENLSLEVDKGEIRGLIGPNGAGKTSFFNALSGRYPINKGKINFDNNEIQNLKPHNIVKLGLARTFQHVTLFKSFTVIENVIMGYQLRSGFSFFDSFINSKKYQNNEEKVREKAKKLLDFVGLKKVLDHQPANLPQGLQKALGIAISLASEPKMLLLDEPCAGMNIQESIQMVDLIKKIQFSGTTVMLIEHDMKVVMKVCDNITVLSFGNKIAEGTPEQVRSNKDVLSAYLGGATYAS